MKKFSLLALTFLIISFVSAQQTGYYNGTDGKNGEELKTALNNIIQNHTQYKYNFAKTIFKISDVDPENSSNVIQVYTGFSHDNSDYGNSGLQLNREHVWAKSHGGFVDWPPMIPMYGDVHNLKPSASTVNQDKSNLDFDNGGAQHDVAIGCYYTDSTWEARDEVKGDIARIIFYMSTRYEGNDGEMDLEVADHNHTYPLAQHGKLSTLLEWNLQDPPDEFERNRNNVIYSFQKNRNPFIDDPNFAELIWGGETPNPIIMDDFQMTPELAVAEIPVQISVTITNQANRETFVNLYWGLSFESLSNSVEMTAVGNSYGAIIPGQSEDATVYYKVVVVDGPNENTSVVYNYYIPKIFTGTIVSIYDIQGQQADSPYEGQVVSTTGVVTGNFGDHYFIQDGYGEWNGLFIYELGRNPLVGDSVIITGEIDEYYSKTEMKNISDYYFISSNNTLPEPVKIAIGEVEEGHESILTKVINATCTDANYQADHYMWKVDDGSGDLKILNTAVFEYVPTEDSAYNITGPMNYDFDEWKIELRFASDVTKGSDFVAPEVISVEPIISTNFKIIFSEDVEQTTAENIANYSINNGVVVESALQHAFNKTQVNLTVTTLSGDYELTVQNVKDLSDNVMKDTTIAFSFVGIEEYLLDGKVEIYPNPASDRLNISFDSKQEFDIEIAITDIAGKQLIYEEYLVKQGINKLSYNLDSFKQGIYLVNLRGEKGTLNYKLIIR